MEQFVPKYGKIVVITFFISIFKTRDRLNPDLQRVFKGLSSRGESTAPAVPWTPYLG